jgi:hypothetical protein
MNTSGAFRMRRVGEWLASNATEEVQKTGGLAEGRGHILATDEYAIIFFIIMPRIYIR